jgi:hypothetical protein
MLKEPSSEQPGNGHSLPAPSRRGCAGYALKVLVSIAGTYLAIVLFVTVLGPRPRWVDQAFVCVLVAWWDYLVVVIPLYRNASSWVPRKTGPGVWLATVFFTSFLYLVALYVVLQLGSDYFAASAAMLLFSGAFLASSLIFSRIFKTTFVRGAGLAVTEISLSLVLAGALYALFLILMLVLAVFNFKA